MPSRDRCTGHHCVPYRPELNLVRRPFICADAATSQDCGKPQQKILIIGQDYVDDHDIKTLGHATCKPKVILVSCVLGIWQVEMVFETTRHRARWSLCSTLEDIECLQHLITSSSHSDQKALASQAAINAILSSGMQL